MDGWVDRGLDGLMNKWGIARWIDTEKNIKINNNKKRRKYYKETTAVITTVSLNTQHAAQSLFSTCLIIKAME